MSTPLTSRAFGLIGRPVHRLLVILAVLALPLAACNGDGNGTELGDSIILAEEVETDEQYGIAVQQDNTALLDAINAELDGIIADGTYEDIYGAWFEGDVPQGFAEADRDAPAARDHGDLGLDTEGVLRVGSDIDFPPFEFVEDGEYRGFDIDLMNEIGDRLGVEVEFVDAAFDTLLTQLATREFDAVISAVTITEERRQTVEFSDPYFAANQGLAVMDGSQIQGVGDLVEGIRVGVQAGTTGEDYAEEHFTDAEVVSFPSAPAAFQQMRAGQLDAVFIDLPVIAELQQGDLDLDDVDEDEADG